MKFGVREICNVVFKAKVDGQKIGNMSFRAGQPVLYIDTATTSTMEGAATQSYANGGRGNSRLISWEGEKTLTFTVEDALLSPISFAMLSGAGLLQDTAEEKYEKNGVHVHMTTAALASDTGVIDLTDVLGADEKICKDAPIFVLLAEADGSIKPGKPLSVEVESGKGLKIKETSAYSKNVFVDYYVVKESAAVSELQIDAEHFAGNYYVEADTLFRDQLTGKDMPANLTFPNVKIQSNFTFNMASTGDPSTFTFTMDALPGYTFFNKTRKVLCAIQIIDDTNADGDKDDFHSVMHHKHEADNESGNGSKTITFEDDIKDSISTDEGYAFDDSMRTETLLKTKVEAQEAESKTDDDDDQD